MALIPADAVDAIKQKIDIVDLVAEYVPNMQRAGRNMKARCPFHQERTPSFVVSPERGTFHCFGCGEGGDCITFVMKIENLSFAEAAEKLASRAGVKLEAQELSAADKEKLKLKEVLGLAAEYYHKVLLSSAGSEAMAYLKRRGVTDKTIAEFKLGYAPKAGELAEKAKAKGYSSDILARAGLTGKRGDFFFDRVLYPIFDTKGAVVAFGGRTLGDGMPKYLNSPESPVFAKSRLLYGLSHGLPAVRKEKRVVLMEGYMDVMAAHQHGLPLACAPLGTALTNEHAGIIKRYAEEATIVFDADSAGLNAAVRGAEILLADGLSVRIATVPGAKDPDELLEAQGLPALQACLDAAVDLVHFKTDLLLKAVHGPLSAKQKSDIAKQVLDTINRSPDEVMKAEWARWLSSRLGLPVDALKTGPAKAAPPAPKLPELDASLVDRLILSYLLKDQTLSSEIRDTDFTSARAVRVWRALGRFDTLTDDEDRRLASRVQVEAPPVDDARAALMKILLPRRLDVRMSELSSRVATLTPAEHEEYKKLTKERYGTAR